MKKTLTALLAAATIAVSLVGTATDVSARDRGGAFAAGLIGGLAAGAIVGGAIANSRPAYAAPAPAYYPVAPAPGYVVYRGYARAVPAPGCYWTRMPLYDAYGNVVGWRGRPVVVCP